MMNMISTTPPEDFSLSMEVASCFCEFEDKILFVKRQAHKPYGSTWCLPGGKLDKGETPRAAAIREVYEEVGLSIESEDLEKIGQLYMCVPSDHILFYMFRKRFLTRPEVDLSSDEHQELRWVTVEEALELPLIIGGVEALSNYARLKTKTEI